MYEEETYVPVNVSEEDETISGLFQEIPKLAKLYQDNIVVRATESDLYSIAGNLNLHHTFIRHYRRQSIETQLVFNDIYHILFDCIQRAIQKDKDSIRRIEKYGLSSSFALIVGAVGAIFWGGFASGSIPIWGPLAGIIVGSFGVGICFRGIAWLERKCRIYWEPQLSTIERLLKKMEKESD